MDDVPSVISSWRARPPRWGFHVLLLPPTLLLLWAVSGPIWSLLALATATAVLCCAALVWMVRVIVFVQKPPRWSWWFLLAPFVGVLVLSLVAHDVPFQKRWEFSRPAFEVAVRDLPPAPARVDEWVPLQTQGRVGAYRVSASRVLGGVIFTDQHVSGTVDTGFAYFPDGPRHDLETGWFESPQFHHLDGPWYVWTASW
ncbi:hypothetical protein [Kineococcus xinjiangensis]|uniref:hypothetical protein n=1 Tax=Kineococcus xinjiangensis TaxID=512762 RepID=UPI0011B04F0D|nr:hypothetical protein [Kineococcus xinjiangensis]